MKNKTLSILRLIKHLILIIAAGMLVSCAAPDPMFSANSRNIQDTDYPKNKIVGMWVHFGRLMLQTEREEMEWKFYYDLLPNGRGRIRQATINRVNGAHMSVEANLTWRYLGKNWWQISLPASTEYRVTDSDRMKLTGNYLKPNAFLVRYYDGNLYDMNTQQVLVRPTHKDVSGLANRIRSSTPTIYMNSGSR